MIKHFKIKKSELVPFTPPHLKILTSRIRAFNISKALSFVDYNLKDYLEFGVYDGTSLSQIEKEVSLESNDYNVYGFDTFTGLPEDWSDADGNTIRSKGFFDMGGQVPKINGVKFFKGVFENTIPEYKKINQPIAFIHIDCDTFKSTKCVLEDLNELIIPNTVILLDEWFVFKQFTKSCEDVSQLRDGQINGEGQAFLEWAKKHQREYEFLDSSPEWGLLGEKWGKGYRKKAVDFCKSRTPEPMQQKTVRIIK